MDTVLNDNILTLLVVVAVIIIVVFLLCILAKLFKIAILIGLLSLLIPILFTVVWGDGTPYVNAVASFLVPAHQERIEEAYQLYLEKSQEDPILDYDKVSDAVTRVFEDTDN